MPRIRGRIPCGSHICCQKSLAIVSDVSTCAETVADIRAHKSCDDAMPVMLRCCYCG